MSSMPYGRLGSTGIKVSAFGFGAWVTFGGKVGVPEAKTLIQTAFDAGVNYFDNAENYNHGRAEEVMGQALQELDLKRHDLVIATKVFFGSQLPDSTINARGLSRKHIVEGVRASLKRLQLEYVDIVFAHRPDPEVGMEEIVRAFNWVIDQGWAFYWGTSEWSGGQVAQAWDIADRLGLVGPSAEQPQYNMFHRRRVEWELASLYESRGLGLTTWSPLASGILTGKYKGGRAPEGSRLAQERFQREGWLAENRAQIDAVSVLEPIAAELGTDTTKLALAWCAKNPNVSTVIMGSSSVEQLKNNLGAIDVMPLLNDEVMERIAQVIKDHGDLPVSVKQV